MEPKKKLAKLMNSCTGKVREVIEPALLMDAHGGLEWALKMISERYGNPLDVTKAYMSNLTKGKQLEQNDFKGLADKMLCWSHESYGKA